MGRYVEFPVIKKILSGKLLGMNETSATITMATSNTSSQTVSKQVLSVANVGVVSSSQNNFHRWDASRLMTLNFYMYVLVFRQYLMSWLSSENICFWVFLYVLMKHSLVVWEHFHWDYLKKHHSIKLETGLLITFEKLMSWGFMVFTRQQPMLKYTGYLIVSYSQFTVNLTEMHVHVQAWFVQANPSLISKLNKCDLHSYKF